MAPSIDGQSAPVKIVARIDSSTYALDAAENGNFWSYLGRHQQADLTSEKNRGQLFRVPGGLSLTGICFVEQQNLLQA
jgi:hypothetical protein